MKKNLILVALVLTLCLVGCNNNKQNTNNNENLNNNVQQDQTTNQNTQDNESEEKDDTPVVVYDSLDFSEKAGFKVVLGEALNDVECTSIFLINNTTTQFNLNFPDNVKGTLLIDPANSSHLFSPDDETTIGETKVSIETGAIKDSVEFIESGEIDMAVTHFPYTTNYNNMQLSPKLLTPNQIEVKLYIIFKINVYVY